MDVSKNDEDTYAMRVKRKIKPMLFIKIDKPLAPVGHEVNDCNPPPTKDEVNLAKFNK